MNINSLGIMFWHNGDEVIWTWPWKRNKKPKFISLLFSGNGDFGDARFNSLKEIDEFWKEYERAVTEK